MGATSWILVNPDGEYFKGLVAQPLSIPEGKRLSVRDVIDGKDVRCGEGMFEIDKNSATGTFISTRTTHGVAQVEIAVIGDTVEDVVAVRNRMLETAGFKRYSYSFPELPDLKKVWDRCRWLFRWLAKGKS